VSWSFYRRESSPERRELRDNVVTPESRKSATGTIAVQADSYAHGVITLVGMKAEILMEFGAREE